MTAPLHLLRAFTGWGNERRQPIRTVDGAEAWVRHIAELGFDRFYTWSSRTPRRADELRGGSVYFVAKRRALFRMPFSEVEPDGDGCAIRMRPELIRVRQDYVGMVRGPALPPRRGRPARPARDRRPPPAMHRPRWRPS